MPDEMAKLLAVATRDFLPCLAIGGFAGLRTSEILALDWRDVRLAERTVKVTRRKARCAGTRLAPITHNLAKWLLPLAQETGPVWPTGQTWRERERSISAAQNATAEAAGLLPWRHSSLGHSFCTFRAAATKNVPQTALEAGNSAATIFSHYGPSQPRPKARLGSRLCRLALLQARRAPPVREGLGRLSRS